MTFAEWANLLHDNFMLSTYFKFSLFTLTLSILTADVSDRADTIFFGGDIITVNAANPAAECVAVRNGKILSVGKKTDAMKWKGEQTKLVDLKGSTLLPGFIALKHYTEQLETPTKEEAKKVAESYAKKGFTTVTDLAIKGSTDPLKEIARDEQAPIRLQGYLPYESIKEIAQLQKDNDSRFKILGVKINQDLNNQVLEARKLNLQIALDVNGTEGVKNALTACENALQQYPKEDHRYLIEHNGLTDDSLLNKMGDLKLAPTFTNQHLYYWEMACKERLLCEPRIEQIDAAGTAKKLGIRFTFNDDVSSSSCSPLLIMEIASIQETLGRSRSNLHERLTVDEAIKAMTLNAAWQTFRDKELGSIEVGKQADFVVLNQNPKKLDPHKIKDIQVVETWISGKKVTL